MKVAGQNSYLHGAYELMEFAYVIRCLIKKTDIDLALVEKVNPSIDRLRDIEDVSGGFLSWLCATDGAVDTMSR